MEWDPEYKNGIDASHTNAQSTAADAICSALRDVVQPIDPGLPFGESGTTNLLHIAKVGA